MAEYIEKHAAISLPVLPKEHRHYQTMNLDDAYEDGWFDALECVEKIHPADVRPVRRGRWIVHYDDIWPTESTQECSECHKEVPLLIDCKYCPNCGSDNGGDADG